MRYMVSYQLFDGSCGNWTFNTPQEARQYVRENVRYWQSYSTFSYTGGLAITELVPVTL